jgi:hypothetical protein
MAKVVTSQGIQDFVATGRPTEVIKIDSAKAQEAAKAAQDAKLAKTDAPEIAAPTPMGAPPEEKPAAIEAKKPDEQESDLDDEEKKLAKDIQKKIFKQIAKRKEAQSEAQTAREEAAEAERFAEQLFNEREQYRRRIEELEKAKPEVPRETTLVKPDPQDKAFYDAEGKFKVWEYSDKLAEYSAKKAVEDDRKEQQKVAAERERVAAEAAFKARIAKATEKYPDWEKVVGASDITLQNECLQYIATSDKGTDVAYYLAQHKEEAERIRGLHPIRAIAELGKIEAGLERSSAPPAKAESPVAEPQRSAPAPITPIATNGTGSVNVDPAKMSFKELRAYRREQARSRH